MVGCWCGTERGCCWGSVYTEKEGIPLPGPDEAPEALEAELVPRPPLEDQDPAFFSFS